MTSNKEISITVAPRSYVHIKIMVSSHGISPFKALYDVLVPQSFRQNRPIATRLPALTRPIPNYIQPVSRRQFSQSVAARNKTRPPEKRTQLWNDEIKTRYVKLVNDEGKLNEPEPLRPLLASFDQKEWRLVCMEKTPEGPDFDRRQWVPVCKLVNRKEEYDKEKAKKSEKKATKKAADPTNIKTLELNWAIDVNNDLNHRLNKVKEFLEQGRKVEIVLAKKKRGRVATREECDEVLKRIHAAVEEVKGAKEAKPMEGKVGAVAMLLLEGPKV